MISSKSEPDTSAVMNSLWLSPCQESLTSNHWYCVAKVMLLTFQGYSSCIRWHTVQTHYCMTKWKLYSATLSIAMVQIPAPLHYFFPQLPASAIYKALDSIHRRQSLLKVFSYQHSWHERKSLGLEPQDSHSFKPLSKTPGMNLWWTQCTVFLHN